MNVAHGMEQFRHLTLTGFHDAGVRMTRGGDTESGGQIEILFPFRVPDVHSLRSLPDDGPEAVGINMGDVARFKVAELSDYFAGTVHSNSPLIRRPDELVHLQLEADGQCVGGDSLHQLHARDRRLI